MKLLVLLFTLLLATPVSYVNYRALDRAKYVEIEGQEINKNLLQQLAFLKREVHSGAANEMQSYYPEGATFLMALYGLTWCEVAEAAPKASNLKQEALNETLFALQSIHEHIDQKVPNFDLDFSKGTFYTSWPLYVQAHLLHAYPETREDSILVKQFEERCASVAQVLSENESPFPESYPGASWPADICPAVAALVLHDQMFPAAYESTVNEWLEKCETRLDHRGLIPHSADPNTGEPLLASMGSSQSLILSFMHEIDSAAGAKMFESYKTHFLAKRLGLPGILEHAKGTKGKGHIDSGPVVWGIGGAASIVGIRAMYLYGKPETARSIRNSVNAFAFVREKKEERYYLLGKWPMADAFMAWSNSLEVTPAKEMKRSKPWKSSFHLGSFLLLLLMGYANKGLVTKKEKLRRA